MLKQKIITSSERTIYSYNYLQSAASSALKQAERTKEEQFYNCMSSIILSAFCIEAYLNHIGEKILPYWDEEFKKGLSIQNKLKVICHELNLSPDYSRTPFQSITDIIKYRNSLAHAESETISDKRTQIVQGNRPISEPETWWEKHTNLKRAKRWLTDIKSVIKEIHKAAGVEGDPFLIMGTGSYSGTLVNKRTPSSQE